MMFGKPDSTYISPDFFYVTAFLSVKKLEFFFFIYFIWNTDCKTQLQSSIGTKPLGLNIFNKNHKVTKLQNHKRPGKWESRKYKKKSLKVIVVLTLWLNCLLCEKFSSYHTQCSPSIPHFCNLKITFYIECTFHHEMVKSGQKCKISKYLHKQRFFILNCILKSVYYTQPNVRQISVNSQILANNIYLAVLTQFLHKQRSQKNQTMLSYTGFWGLSWNFNNFMYFKQTWNSPAP